MQAKNCKSSLLFGFTLIELSIVLVIIGLVVGGVLVGRDLIKAAEIRAQVNQIEQMETAYNTFKLKYNCIAGDCPNATDFFGTTVSTTPLRYIVNGNGDGEIYGEGGAYGVQGNASVPSPNRNCLHVDVTAKISQLLLHLTKSGLANYTADGNNDFLNVYHQAAVSTVGVTFPYTALGNGTGIFITCLHDTVWSNLTPKFLNTGNVIVIGSGSGYNQIGIEGNLSLTKSHATPIYGTVGIPIDVIRQIDLKMDDGVPNTGKFGIIMTEEDCGGATLPNGYNGQNITSYPSPSSVCLAVGGKKIQ